MCKFGNCNLFNMKFVCNLIGLRNSTRIDLTFFIGVDFRSGSYIRCNLAKAFVLVKLDKALPFKR